MKAWYEATVKSTTSPANPTSATVTTTWDRGGRLQSSA